MLALRRAGILSAFLLLAFVAFPGTTADPAVSASADAAELQAPSCRDRCNQEFRACMDAGIDTDVCEALWRRCVAVCDAIEASITTERPTSISTSTDAGSAALASAPCPRDCRQEYEDCIDDGGEIDFCENVFKACFAFCNLWRSITNAVSGPQVQATLPAEVRLASCEDTCREYLLQCSNACGTDQRCVDKCETTANLCMAACKAIRSDQDAALAAMLPAPACLQLVTAPVQATL